MSESAAKFIMPWRRSMTIVARVRVRMLGCGMWTMGCVRRCVLMRRDWRERTDLLGWRQRDDAVVSKWCLLRKGRRVRTCSILERAVCNLQRGLQGGSRQAVQRLARQQRLWRLGMMFCKMAVELKSIRDVAVCLGAAGGVEDLLGRKLARRWHPGPHTVARHGRRRPVMEVVVRCPHTS